MQIRQLSSLSSTNSMIHVLFVWSLQCAFYAAAIMHEQWRCEKQFVSLIWNHYKNQSIDFHQLCHQSRKSESQCYDSGICPAKGILNLAKIRCGIRENARYLNRERDIAATREARFATGCGIFLPVYREFGKSYLLRGKRESTQRLTVDSFQTKL